MNFEELDPAAFPAWSATDYGLVAWSFDPSAATSTYTLATAGVLYLAQLKVLPGLVSNVVYDVTTAGGTLTASECFVGVYSGGALVAQSADQSTAWASTGVITTALTSPYEAGRGALTVAFLFNGTTGPTLATGSAKAAVNAGIAATSSRYGSAGTSRTTLPTTLPTVAALPEAIWVALS